MEKIAEILWNEVFRNNEIMNEEESKKQELLVLLEKHRKTIFEKSNEDVIAAFRLYEDCLSEYNYYAEKEIFSKGFSAGVRVIAEAFS